MSKGIIYIMTTAVPGLVKIGKTNTTNFKDRMYNLEHNGYRNVTALKREFAIEVEDFDQKEAMLHNIFEKSRVDNTELFALDVNLAIQLLSSFEGTIVYPISDKKSDIFAEATEGSDNHLIPDGQYTFNRTRQKDGKSVNVVACVKDGEWTLCKGSIVLPDVDRDSANKTIRLRAQLNMDSGGHLLDDCPLGHVTPSCAASVCFGGYINGWDEWKTRFGKPINVYRQNKRD